MTGPFWVSKREAAVTKSQLMIIYTINVDFPVCLLLDAHISTCWTSIGLPINQVIGGLIGSSKDISLVSFDFLLRILRGLSTLGFKS